MIIKQGEPCSLPIVVNIDGVIITPSDVLQIEMVFQSAETISGSSTVTKEYPSEYITFNTDHFLISLTAEETSSFSGVLRCEISVTLPDGSIKKSPIQTLYTTESLDKSTSWGSTTIPSYINGDEVLY